MKYFVILLAVIFLAASLGAVVSSLFDFRTDSEEQDYLVSTGAGVTNSTVQLARGLWDDSVGYASVASNDTSEIPIAYSYNSTTRALTVTGLNESAARTLTVTYSVGALDDYTGADSGTSFIPVAILLAVILVPLVLFVNSLKGRF